MTTPNDPYNSANPRPFDDDHILEPIVEKTERPLPETPAEEIANGTVETDNAPDFGDVPPLPQEEKAWWDQPAEPHYSANQFANIEPNSTMPDPDLPAPAAPAENTNPTLGTFFGETETVAPAAIAVAAAADNAAPTRTSVMEAADELPLGEHRDEWNQDPGDITDIPDKPPSRGWTHTGSFFATLLLLPLAWYLISDAGARFYLVENNPWAAKSFALFPFIELLGGLVTIALIWLLARASSLGAQFWGAFVTVGGLIALIVPALAQRGIAWLDAQIGSYNAFTGNVIHHLELDFGTGRIAILGFILFMTGVAAHSARRRGQVYATAITRRELLLPATAPETTDEK